MKATKMNVVDGITIGGSSIAALLGVSDYETPAQAITRLKGKQIINDNKVIRRNSIAKQYLMQYCEETFGFKYIEKQMVINIGVIHDTVDAFGIDDNGEFVLFEFKTSEYIKDIEQIPIQYKLQCIWYCGLFNINKCKLIVGDGCFNVRRFIVVKDDELFNHIDERIGDMYQRHIIGEEPVPLTDNELINQFAQLKETSKNIITSDEISSDMINAYITLKAQQKAIEDGLKSIEHRIKSIIGDNDGVRCGDVVFTWLPKKRKNIDLKRLNEEKPDVYANYVKHTTHRVFKMKRLKVR